MIRIHGNSFRTIAASLASCAVLLTCGFSEAQVRSMTDYLTMREQVSDDQEGHLTMARWARAQGLTEQARAHTLRLLDFDPENEQARRDLGHVNIDGRWFTAEQVEEMNAESRRQTQLNQQWAKPVAEAAKKISSPRRANQERGKKMLDAINDVGATFAIEQQLCSLPMPQAELGIQKLHSFEGEDATAALLRVAVNHNHPDARQLATNLLAERKTDDYIGMMVESLESPVISQFILSQQGMGRMVHRHVFVQRRFDQDVVRQYDQMHIATLSNPQQTEPNAGEVNQILNQNGENSRAAAQRMEQARASHNRSIDLRNRRLMDVLSQVTGENAGSSPEDWWNWWYEQNDVKYYQRPTSYKAESLAPSYTRGTVAATSIPGMTGTSSTSGTVGRSCECFVAGTLVWTERGRLPIETLTTGDRVLARDLKSNQLVYRNVINRTTREPSPTVLIHLPNETLQVSGGHPFHVSGEGWVRARDLKAGMALTGRESPVVINDVSNATVALLFNLVIERDSNYYVGQKGVLSHDHTIPATRIVAPKPAP